MPGVSQLVGRFQICLIVLVYVFCPVPFARGETLTYVDLIGRLVDVKRVAVLPMKGETVSMVSSYNRRSRYDAATDRYLEWGANDDGGGHANLPTLPDGSVVLADLKGPGCIWRTWAALAGKGHVKMFIDDDTRPAVDLPFNEWFTGQHAPFNRKGLTYPVASGNDSYVPIPFQKSLRIVGERGWGDYFQFTYATFSTDTTVPTFNRNLSPEENAALDHASETLLKPADEHGASATSEQKQITLAPGQSINVLELTGEGAITSIRASVIGTIHRADQIAALREVTLSIRWDGSADPAVWTPLGDFFGSAMGLNAYQSAMSGMSADGTLFSRWYMPFGKGAVATLTNDGPLPRTVAISFAHEPLTQPIETLGRFHAKWHRDAFISPRADRWPDWTMLAAKGRGKFVGVMLHVWNPRAGHNRQFGREGDWWWGEGDEKLFIDGEKFPSTFGTGTEDYFGYAWCDPTLFQRPFHGQTLAQLNKGHQSLYRWHVTDAVPFQSSFEGALEKYYANVFPTKYAAVAYWYLDANSKDDYKPCSLADRADYFDLTDALEGENLKVVSLTGGKAEPQVYTKDRTTGEGPLSGGRQLWWTGQKEGDELVVDVPVVYDGVYRVHVGTLVAPDYGVVEYRLADDRPLGPVNCFAPEAGPSEIDLGEHTFKRGETRLAVKMLAPRSHRPDAKPGNFASIDYVKLERVR